MERQSIPMEELMKLLLLQMEHGGQALLTVTGVSMLPMLVSDRDAVYLELPHGKLRPGDVILYRRNNGSYVLHRIIACGQDLICCGDNQWQRESVPREQVIALVTAFQRKGKYCNVHNPLYRIYVWCWVKLFFLRRPYIALRRRVGIFLSKLKKNK